MVFSSNNISAVVKASTGFESVTSAIPVQCFTFYGYITNSQSCQLPVGLIAQLVEHCTSIAKVMDSNPLKIADCLGKAKCFFCLQSPCTRNMRNIQSLLWSMSLLASKNPSFSGGTRMKFHERPAQNTLLGIFHFFSSNAVFGNALNQTNTFLWLRDLFYILLATPNGIKH